MTFREKLADWLTGGTYSDACSFADDYFATRDTLDKAEDNLLHYRKQLESIASIPVTPSSNGQTRKAVRIAREVLS